MVKKKIILKFNKVLNDNGLKPSFKRRDLARYMRKDDIEDGLRTGILKWSVHASLLVDYDRYFRELLDILGLGDADYEGLVDIGLRSASVTLNEHLRLKLYLASIISSDTIRDILEDEEEGFIVPIILTSRKEADEFRTSEEYEPRRDYLSRGALHRLNILSFFIPVLPLPENISNLKYYKESLKKIKTLLSNINIKIDNSLDEVSLIKNYKDLVVYKTLASFLHLYKGLYYAPTTKFRNKAKNPDYWFEYILKTLLTKFLVEHHFPKEITDYLYNEYKVGGKCEEDIAIPILQDDRLGIIIVDAKLWKNDVCYEIKKNTEKLLRDPEIVKIYECGKKQKRPKESLMKYLWYINKKSSKLLKLENILASTLSKDVDFYHLLIVQPGDSNKDCYQALIKLQEKLVKINDKKIRAIYSNINIISLNNLIKILKH